ncbi:MAG: hypothetical protein ACR2ND_08180 [Solirubrobacteraceae bacterium]
MNNSQAATQAGTPAGGTAIVNGSQYAPSLGQGAANVNVSAVSARKPGITSGGDTFTLTGGSTKINQGINNAQAGHQGTLGAAILVLNASAFAPLLSQSAGNANISTKSGRQAIDNSQLGSQGSGSSAGTLIIDRTSLTAAVRQASGSVNCTGSLTTCTADGMLLLGRI